MHLDCSLPTRHIMRLQLPNCPALQRPWAKGEERSKSKGARYISQVTQIGVSPNRPDPELRGAASRHTSKEQKTRERGEFKGIRDAPAADQRIGKEGMTVTALITTPVEQGALLTLGLSLLSRGPHRRGE